MSDKTKLVKRLEKLLPTALADQVAEEVVDSLWLAEHDEEVRASVVAEEPEAPSDDQIAMDNADWQGRLLPDPEGGCCCTWHAQDAGGGHTEYLMEYEPACPEHSEHVYNPRTGIWERAEESNWEYGIGNGGTHWVWPERFSNLDAAKDNCPGYGPASIVVGRRMGPWLPVEQGDDDA